MPTDQRVTIIVSRSTADDPQRRAVEAALLDHFAAAAGNVRVLLVPHAYHLWPEHPAACRLRELDGPVAAVAGWLHPRALRWTLAALGCDPGPDAAVVDLRETTDPAAAASALIGDSGAAPGAGGDPPVEDLAESVPPRWYPVLDYDRCVGCRQCAEFCLFDVYAVEDEGVVHPANPDNCKDGCPACARLCPHSAIIFPECPDDPAISGADVPFDTAESAPAGPGDDELDDLIDTLDRMDDL